MKKKLGSVLLLFLIIFAVASPSYADSKYQVNTPNKSAISTTKNTVLISGKAPIGTEISVDVYGAANIRGRNYSLKNLPEDKDYILISKQNISAGVAGFGEEVKLIKGINKIIVSFKVDGVDSVQRIVYHYDASELKRIR